jgi:hypothetical protein
MNNSLYFTVEGEHAVFRPSCHVSLKEAVAMVSSAINHARHQRIKELLLVTTGMTGFESPSVSDRFCFVNDWCTASKCSVKMAFVARPEHIDPNKFGIMVARNRGEQAEVFTTEAEALAWLKGGNDNKAAEDSKTSQRSMIRSESRPGPVAGR